MTSPVPLRRVSQMRAYTTLDRQAAWLPGPQIRIQHAVERPTWWEIQTLVQRSLERWVANKMH